MRCAKLKLSMQEIFQELAQRVVDGDKRVIQVLEDYKRQKRNRETDTLVGKADVKEIFSLIRDSSPIKEAGED